MIDTFKDSELSIGGEFTCPRCQRKFDPMYDFVDDIDLIESFYYFCTQEGTEEFCPDCIYDWEKDLKEATDKWRKEGKWNEG